MASREGVTVNVYFRGVQESFRVPFMKRMEGGTSALMESIRNAFGLQSGTLLQLRRRIPISECESAHASKSLKLRSNGGNAEQIEVDSEEESDSKETPLQRKGPIVDASTLIFAEDNDDFDLEELSPLRFSNAQCQSSGDEEDSEAAAIHAPVHVQHYSVLGRNYLQISVTASGTSTSKKPLRVLRLNVLSKYDSASFVDAVPVYEEKSTMSQSTSSFGGGLNMSLTAGVSTAAMVPTATAGGSLGMGANYSSSHTRTRVTPDYETFFALRSHHTMDLKPTQMPTWSLCLTSKGKDALDKTLKNAEGNTRLTLSNSFTSVWEITGSGPVEFLCLIQAKDKENGVSKLQFTIACYFSKSDEKHTYIDPLVVETSPSAVHFDRIVYFRSFPEKNRKFSHVPLGTSVRPLMDGLGIPGHGQPKWTKRKEGVVLVITPAEAADGDIEYRKQHSGLESLAEEPPLFSDWDYTPEEVLDVEMSHAPPLPGHLEIQEMNSKELEAVICKVAGQDAATVLLESEVAGSSFLAMSENELKELKITNEATNRLVEFIRTRKSDIDAEGLE